jgi:choline-sulfatase
VILKNEAREKMKRKTDIMVERRRFVQCAVAGTALATSTKVRAQGKKARRPNIIYIFTDQQSATMMSCTGNKYLKTPAADYLAANGVRFEKAYTPNPVCVPARTSMMTGHFPGSHGVRLNSNSNKFNKKHNYEETNIAAQLDKAGYALAYGGKTHLPKEVYPDALGFEVMSTGRKMDLSEDAVEFIKRKHDKPYYLVLSYINPHDICYFFRTDLGKKHALVEELRAKAKGIPNFYESDQCPPLVPNFEPQPDEPAAYQAMKQITLDNRETITEKDWRLSRWMYARMTEIVDAEIKVVLDTLKQTGQEENTVVIFSSDHGDNEGAYHFHGKNTFNEQSIRIPFIVMDKGGNQKAGTVDEKHFVINGVDLLPTVLDYAGVPGAKGDPRGRSVRPLVEGKKVEWREDVGVESALGRMVMNDRFKYIEYDIDRKIEVRLRDMKNDPHEKTHCTNDPERAPDVVEMKAVFDRWFPDPGSPVFNKNKRKKAPEPKKEKGTASAEKPAPVAKPVPGQEYEQRRWAVGRAKEAVGSFVRIFVNPKGKKLVMLRAPDGKEFNIRFQAMTPEDRAYLESIEAD